MIFRVLILIFPVFLLNGKTAYSSNQNIYQRKYEIEENANDDIYPNQRSVLLPRSTQDQSQYNLNQYNQLNQLNQLQQLNQQNQQSQFNAQQDTHQYLNALQQYYIASKKQQNPSVASPGAYSQFPNQQQIQLPAQQNYQHPLGVLYSAATDVSQFHFSGNGVNYSF